MTISPKTKQILSGLVVGVASAAGFAVEQALASPPFTLHSLLVAAGVGALTGLVHYLPTLGTKAATQAEVVKTVAAIVEKESL